MKQKTPIFDILLSFIQIIPGLEIAFHRKYRYYVQLLVHV